MATGIPAVARPAMSNTITMTSNVAQKRFHATSSLAARRLSCSCEFILVAFIGSCLSRMKRNGGSRRRRDPVASDSGTVVETSRQTGNCGPRPVGDRFLSEIGKDLRNLHGKTGCPSGIATTVSASITPPDSAVVEGSSRSVPKRSRRAVNCL